jgi:large subunit ribosomal protein L21
MYAVIKTGGKQYRVQAGDLLVVEKLEGEPGAKIAFSDVLMLGDGADVALGSPLVEGAAVNATLIETRKGEKIKIFKKIRRQGYRRTGGHRQHETILRVTSIAGAGKEETWEGEIDLTPVATLRARARNLARGMEAAETKAAARAARKAGAAPAAADAPAVKTPVKAPTKAKAPAKAAVAKPADVEAVAAEPAAVAKPATKAKPAAKAPAKAAAPKAAAAKTDAPKAAAKAPVRKKPTA